MKISISMTVEERKAKKTEYMRKWREENRSHRNAYCKAWRENNKEKVVESSKKSNKKNKEKCKERARRYAKSEACKIYRKTKKPYLSRYGITLSDYNKMFEQQEGKCIGCTRHQSELESSLCVDHCHVTGKVRGLLCTDCNKALGLVRDNTSILKRLINYLENE
jgi:hypothetical protein